MKRMLREIKEVLAMSFFYFTLFIGSILTLLFVVTLFEPDKVTWAERGLIAVIALGNVAISGLIVRVRGKTA